MRKTEKSVLAATLLLACAGSLAAQQIDDAHRPVYRKTADSVVAIRAMPPLGARSGSGVILSKQGLLRTRYAPGPHGATNIHAWVTEHRPPTPHTAAKLK